MPQTFGGAGAPEAWSYASFVHGGLDHVLDDEGRPLAERRAPSSVKQGVPIVLKPCPYADERQDRAMNVSALAQITRHLDAALDDMAAFHAAVQGGETRWEHVLTGVVDQLGAPALLLLRAPGTVTVPAATAVAHKLAAGYFGVVRGIVTAAASGSPRSLSVDGLLSYAHETRAFVGASEACAGPPPLLSRVTRVLLHGDARAAPLVDRARVDVATLFRQQIQLGIGWQLFDATLEPVVLEMLRGARPRTELFRGILDERRRILEAAPRLAASAAAAALPYDLPPPLASGLMRAFAPEGARERPPPAELASLGEIDAGAVVFSGTDARATLFGVLVSYLDTYAAVVSALVALEERLRFVLGLPETAPVRLHETILPRAAALHWMEKSLGCRTTCPAAVNPRVTIVPLPKPVLATGSAIGPR